MVALSNVPPLRQQHTPVQFAILRAEMFGYVEPTISYYSTSLPLRLRHLTIESVMLLLYHMENYSATIMSEATYKICSYVKELFDDLVCIRDVNVLFGKSYIAYF